MSTKNGKLAADRRRERRANVKAGHTPTKVDDLLTGYSRTFLTCRDLGHAWVVVGLFRYGSDTCRRMECSRCTATRTQVLGRQAETRTNRYRHPDGYLIEGANVSRADVRRASIAEAAVFGNETELEQWLAAQARRARRRTAAK